MNSLASLAHRGQLGWGFARWQALSPIGQSWISEDLTIWCFLTQPQPLVCSTCPKPQLQGLFGAHQRTPGYDRASSGVFSGTLADGSRWPETSPPPASSPGLSPALSLRMRSQDWVPGLSYFSAQGASWATPGSNSNVGATKRGGCSSLTHGGETTHTKAGKFSPRQQPGRGSPTTMTGC